MPISIGLLDFSVTASFCGSFINLCAYQFIWSLELTPITYLPNATHPALHQEPVCIGPEPRCQFSSIQEYLTQRGDTSRYLPNGLTIVLPSLATSFSAGYDADVVFIINQLTTLE
ncbi:hypothetical protein HaLaN_16342 [Haematococcus lacustris]|uniref:Uncharacterized protein n=1 Tax=Haematococcus lacustris TaxID=44745 RepID=A0A699ZDH2_HAELA|nr:hypothetical protein HaLaN_16342 [Haematococcus lacustris]